MTAKPIRVPGPGHPPCGAVAAIEGLRAFHPDRVDAIPELA